MKKLIEKQGTSRFVVAGFVAMWAVIRLPVILGISSMMSKTAAVLIPFVLSVVLLTWLLLSRSRQAE